MFNLSLKYETHVVLQQDEHAPLCLLFGCDELVPRLLDLLHRDFPSPSPLVVKVQSTTVQLLQLVLRNRSQQTAEVQREDVILRSVPLYSGYNAYNGTKL